MTWRRAHRNPKSCTRPRGLQSRARDQGASKVVHATKGPPKSCTRPRGLESRARDQGASTRSHRAEPGLKTNWNGRDGLSGLETCWEGRGVSPTGLSEDKKCWSCGGLARACRRARTTCGRARPPRGMCRAAGSQSCCRSTCSAPRPVRPASGLGLARHEPQQRAAPEARCGGAPRLASHPVSPKCRATSGWQGKGLGLSARCARGRTRGVSD